MYSEDEEDEDDDTPAIDSTKTKQIKQKYESIKVNIEKANARL